ncbi:unnamed protein product, partial [Larinioides sclopetarius]
MWLNNFPRTTMKHIIMTSYTETSAWVTSLSVGSDHDNEDQGNHFVHISLYYCLRLKT